ncbi:uncharacterized protein LOC128726569 [Anopheles nili]|uniref:uncharacterized protein LOC128726569 n=1 Tax=Anopheles nili TaxID=185578 RepID=UPI00237BB6C6|nr:uncharacterized protein LOC128726569 [Anopheles nili]
MDEKLWDFGQKLPCENKFQAVLKAGLLNKSLKKYGVDIMKHNAMCKKCHISWMYGYFSVKVIPGCKRVKKQIEKMENQADLTKQQLSLVKYLKTRVGRVAKYTCHICSYITRVPLDARVKWPTRASHVEALSTSTPQQSSNEWLEETQKKRNRHRKTTAGLKLPPKTQQASSISKMPEKKPAKKFSANDFRRIQQLLASSVSSNPTVKPNQKR